MWRGSVERVADSRYVGPGSILDRAILDTLELMMGGDKKDEKSKEEAVRIHWSTDPVHANLHSYYKLASNLLDYHKK